MISKTFVDKLKKRWAHKLRETDYNIIHSKNDTSENSVACWENGELIIGKHKYISNWVVGDARYDVILGMPWHNAVVEKTDYTKRIVILNDGQELQAEEKKDYNNYARVSSMSIKQFRRRLKKNKIVELYHVSIKNLKSRKSWRERHENIQRKLKGDGDQNSGKTFEILKGKHKTDSELTEILEDNKEIFRSRLPDGLPPKRAVDHKIEIIEGSKIPFQKLYQLSPSELMAAKQYISENLASGKIRPSKSPYGSPLFFAKEKDGTLRGVVDYRGLNRITKRNNTAIPRCDEMFDRLGQATFFSKIDLKTGFHQIRIHPDDIEKTAFTTKYGQFEYTVMAMGLCNAPATFQTLMNSIFRDIIDNYMVVYMDDLLIFSNTAAEHRSHIKTVLRRLKENNLYVSPKKCSFFQDEVEFLGLMVGKNGIRVDPAKTEVVEKWPRPQSLTELRGFLGLVQFFRRFIKKFSGLAQPLTELTKKGKGIGHWNEKCDEAFNQLKSALTNAPILVSPNWNKKFTLHVDASQVAVGGTLTQEDDEGRTRVISYTSKKMTPAEQNYTTNDRELLALVHGLQRFRCYLEGSTFSVITDNQVVSHFFSKSNLSRREARWLELLADFNISALTLKSGKINVLGDALSRITKNNFIQYNNIDILTVDEDDSLKQKLRDYSKDQAFGTIYNSFKNMWPEDHKERRRVEMVKQRFKVKDGYLLYESKICVPRKAIPELLNLGHDAKTSGHFGFKKTLGRMDKYHWKHKTRDVRKYCEGCMICQQHKDHNGQPLNDPTALELPKRRWGLISTDFITQLPKTTTGMDAITTWVDRLSRRVHFLPSRCTDTAIDVAKSFFQNIFPQHGIPDAIISDRDPKFISKFWKQLMSLCGVKLKMSSARHPQTDGASEVMNRVLENYLRCFCNHKQNDWDILLPAAEFAYNSAVSEDLGTSPFEVDLGWRPRDPLSVITGTTPVQAVDDFIEGLKGAFEDARYAHTLAKARQSVESGIHSKKPNYKTGDMVWVSRKLWIDHYTRTRPSAKLSARWFGPFQIMKLVGNNAVRIQFPEHVKTHPVVHVSLTKPAVDKPEHLNQVTEARPRPLQIDDDGNQLFVVERILAHRKKGRGYQWLTLMKGTPTHDAQWQPTKDFIDNDGTMTKAFLDYISAHNLLPELRK